MGQIESHALTGGKIITFENVQIGNITKHAFYLKNVTLIFNLTNNNIRKMESEIILPHDIHTNASGIHSVISRLIR